MERQDAIRKVKALRNTNGRTGPEADNARTMAARLMAAHNISESELSTPVFDFSAFRPTYSAASQQRSAEAAEAIRQAREAMFWASQASAQARRERAQAAWTRPTPKAKPARKAPRRGAFEGTAQDWEMHPNEIRDFMKAHGIRTNGELAGFAGVSASLVSEWMGKGRQRLVARRMWETFYVPRILRALGK